MKILLPFSLSCCLKMGVVYDIIFLDNATVRGGTLDVSLIQGIPNQTPKTNLGLIEVHTGPSSAAELYDMERMHKRRHFAFQHSLGSLNDMFALKAQQNLKLFNTMFREAFL